MARKRTLTFEPEAFLKKVGRERSSREYSDKQAIFSQGDAAEAMFYVEAGNVKQTVLSKGGKKAVIAIFHKGDVFGESCLGPAMQQTSTAVAVQISRVTRVERATIMRIVHDDPAFARLLIAQLLSRIARMEENVLDQLFNSSEKRLARTLLLLASFERESRSEGAALNISQGTLAEMIGTTRSRVSFFMNRFRRKGYIEYNGCLRVRRSLLTFLLQE
jgi:CRP/FNR family transcriptional regulator, cyclic AMP receptor protein